MNYGVAIFFTDYSIGPIEIGTALEEQVDAAFNPPAEPDILKRYRDACIDRVIFSIASEDKDKTLATLDKLAAAMRRAG
jgi:hypothetical protein